MKRLRTMAVMAAMLIAPCSLVCAGSVYEQGFESDTAGWNDYGGTVTRVASGTGGIPSGSGGWHAVLDITTSGGAYTFGDPPADPPHGNQHYLAPGFGTFTQSIDIYIDPAMGTVGDYWDMEVTLEDHAGNGGYGEFNFQAKKTQEGYFIGRHGDMVSDPIPAEHEVTVAGWYTLTSTWEEGIGELLDSHTISGPGGFYQELGDMAGAQPALDPQGATAGYMWIFGRDGSELSLALDNVVYASGPAGQPIPEPLTMAGLVLGLGSLAGYVRRRREG